VRRNAGRDALGRLDRDREVGRVPLVGFADHQRQAKLPATVPRHRQADESAPVRRHVVDVFGAHLLGRHDQVAFVLATLIVDHDDHLAVRNVGNDVLDVTERGVGSTRV
jgi:hypothetical protein